ncbi:MAG: efflux RND transporter periplasmic adaptor subunit [Planctomycetes bacterium]|nr:efflux RND transporter periplasmic adaptor subunit [Planctomycetota bacterium]MCB9910345.1 efflux RND transporter periplasmic adaptor subunit [Planctomycetota bacterium]MCB9912044.1 efflux RND transporter periplasmic adaptor subunit [Planctomycetota bacterium]
MLSLLVLGACGGGGSAPSAGPGGGRPPAPVETADIGQGSITLRRVFSGTLEASAEVPIAPRVTGPVKRLAVDLGDLVQAGQVVAWIDDAELQQAVLQADADLAVARATQAEAQAQADYSKRALERRESLGAQGVTSLSELDSVRATSLADQAGVAVAVARVQRAEAALETARLRLQQAQVVADWEEPASLPEGSAEGPPVHSLRAVSARFVDEGSIVSAGTPLISIVALQPIVATVMVPERDFARLQVGMTARITTDAYAGETFAGRVARVAPVFSRATRQVRIEIELPNLDLRLKPGMFVRAELQLAQADEATLVPYAALTQRGGQTGVFVLTSPGPSVRWTPVTVGIREGDRVQITGEGLTGQVVTLGQELCDDGSPVVIAKGGLNP